jgi:hypothetical protein
VNGAVRRAAVVVGIALVLAINAFAGPKANALGPPTVLLRRAAPFAVLAGTAITNTGNSAITGDIGAPAVTGITPGMITGTDHGNDQTTIDARTDLDTAYADAAGRTPTLLTGPELGGTTVPPGVYNTAAGTMAITGNVVLDGQNDPSAVFIFQMLTTLTTAADSSVTLINSAQACNVFWQVGSSATLGTNSVFKGNIMALTSISITTGVNLEGRALARNGAVTLDTDVITGCTCP